MPSNSKIITAALSNLSPRQREVLVSRFGLEKADGETLAAIGERLDITRERVRQIENSAIQLAKENISASDETVAMLATIKKYISTNGGVTAREDVVKFASSNAAGLTGNQIDFLSEASGAFTLFRENDDYAPFYYVSEKDLKTARSFVDGWVKNLKAKKQKVFEESYHTQLASFVKSAGMDQKIADTYLGISKSIAQNPYGDKGLREWPEINPSTIRDKIYLVLKKKGEAIHFADIATHINTADFDDHKALVATVHNELIKDDRFSLVGRGIYGLKEHGFEPGTAREAIALVLKKKGPLTPDDVVSHVNQGHFFKPNTILINLQNKTHFQRLPDGKYTVRES